MESKLQRQLRSRNMPCPTASTSTPYWATQSHYLPCHPPHNCSTLWTVWEPFQGLTTIFPKDFSQHFTQESNCGFESWGGCSGKASREGSSFVLPCQEQDCQLEGWKAAGPQESPCFVSGTSGGHTSLWKFPSHSVILELIAQTKILN